MQALGAYASALQALVTVSTKVSELVARSTSLIEVVISDLKSNEKRLKKIGLLERPGSGRRQDEQTLVNTALICLILLRNIFHMDKANRFGAKQLATDSGLVP